MSYSSRDVHRSKMCQEALWMVEGQTSQGLCSTRLVVFDVQPSPSISNLCIEVCRRCEQHNMYVQAPLRKAPADRTLLG